MAVDLGRHRRVAVDHVAQLSLAWPGAIESICARQRILASFRRPKPIRRCRPNGRPHARRSSAVESSASRAVATDGIAGAPAGRARAQGLAEGGLGCWTTGVECVRSLDLRQSTVPVGRYTSDATLGSRRLGHASDLTVEDSLGTS